MKVIFRLLLLVAIMASLVFGYYWLMQKYATPPDGTIIDQKMSEWRQASERGEVIVVEGRLTRADGGYYLVFDDRSRVAARSDSLSLSSFIDKRVTVWGGVRGESLIINKIQELQ